MLMKTFDHTLYPTTMALNYVCKSNKVSYIILITHFKSPEKNRKNTNLQYKKCKMR